MVAIKDPTAALARSITWSGSKQAYYTARLMVDRDLRDDFARAYAYLRWADDVVDVTARSQEERIGFIDRQLLLIDRLYRNERPADLAAEEAMLAALIENDRGPKSGLQSFIRNMMAIIEFDARRKGRLISQGELDWYTERVANSVTDGLQYFIGHGYPHPEGADRLLAVKASHISHLLRDMLPDIAQGYVNIPGEYLDAHRIGPSDVGAPAFQEWVRDRVKLARDYFAAGKRYFDRADVLRVKTVVNWYCARFEGLLDTIERERFILRERYNDRRKLPTLLKILWQGIWLPVRHISSGGMRTPRP